MSASSTAVFTPAAGDAEADALFALARLSRITLLVGEMPLERSSAIRNRLQSVHATSGATARSEVVLVLDAWDRPPLRALGAQLSDALARWVRLPPDAGQVSTYGLAPTLATWQEVAGSFLIVLARFEQFLRAEPETAGFRDFEDELLRLVNDESVPANVVIALSEDAEALFLERFGERLPDACDARIHLQSPVAVSGAAPATEAAASRSDSATEPSDARAPTTADARAVAADVAAPVAAVAESPEMHAHQRPGAKSAAPEAAPPAHSPAEPRVPGRVRSWFAAWDRDHVVRAAAPPVALVQLGLLVILLSGPAEPPVDTAVASAPETSAAAPAATELHDAQPPQAIGVHEDGPPPLADAADDSVDERALLPEGVTPPASRIVADAPTAGGADAQRARAPATPTPAPPPPPAVKAAAAPRTSAPAVYVHVRNEAQRAWVQQRAPLLAQHGIRLSGIKVVSEGPRVADLRYFHPEERQEATEVARALREIGLAAQVKHIGGFEQRATRGQYELWLPPSGTS